MQELKRFAESNPNQKKLVPLAEVETSQLVAGIHPQTGPSRSGISQNRAEPSHMKHWKRGGQVFHVLEQNSVFDDLKIEQMWRKTWAVRIVEGQTDLCTLLPLSFKSGI